MKRIISLIVILIFACSFVQGQYNIVRLQDYPRITSSTYVLKDTSTLIHLIRDSAFFGGTWVHKNMTVGNFARMLDQVGTLNGSKIWLQNSYGYRENDTTQYVGVGTTRPAMRFSVADTIGNIFGVGGYISLFGPPAYYQLLSTDFTSYVKGIGLDVNGVANEITYIPNRQTFVNDTDQYNNGQTIFQGPLQLFCSMFTSGDVLTVDGLGNATWQASTGGWSLVGNSGTNTGTNFIGTTDNNGLGFAVNNIPVAEFDTAGNFVLNTNNISAPNGLNINPGGYNNVTITTPGAFTFNGAGVYANIGGGGGISLSGNNGGIGLTCINAGDITLTVANNRNIILDSVVWPPHYNVSGYLYNNGTGNSIWQNVSAAGVTGQNLTGLTTSQSLLTVSTAGGNYRVGGSITITSYTSGTLILNVQWYDALGLHGYPMYFAGGNNMTTGTTFTFNVTDLFVNAATDITFFTTDVSFVGTYDAHVSAQYLGY